MQKYTLADISSEIGKAPLLISNIQKALKLPIPKDGYSKSYLLFLKKVISMQSFSISLDRIHELLETEKKILKLLHIDSSSNSETWCLDGCTAKKRRSAHLNYSLLLTGFNLGFPISGDSIQDNLNFGKPAADLFYGVEMGEDVRCMLRKYRQMLQKIMQQMETERPILEQALRWARSVSGNRKI